MAEGFEECDGSDRRGNTCINNGYESGIMRCYPDCTLNYESCYFCGEIPLQAMEGDTVPYALPPCY